ncbi:MAG: ABC transporter permease [Bacteroidetes bacterium]|nr:ABC transporter permease [Bacteroidota bacterium]
MSQNAFYTFLYVTGDLARFAGQFFPQLVRPEYEIREGIRQSYLIGVKSLGLISLTTFIIGMVLCMQIRPYMVDFGVVSELPAILCIAIIREVGPVLTALVFAGKIASSISAELASMRVTEQIDAMDVSGTNPYKYLVVTRVLACTLMLPLLSVLACGLALTGSFLAINLDGFTSYQIFWSEVFSSLNISDVLPAFLKTFFFGFVVGMVGCYKGYFSKTNTQGVGESANRAVVLSSILIFVVDLFVVGITYLLGFI